MFGTLTEKINHAFSKLKNKGALSELEVKNALRDVRVALLEADVNFMVAKSFVKAVTERATGEDILKGLNPSQQVIKIVNEELIKLMGSTHAKLNVASEPPTVIMMCGLQGSGKNHHVRQACGNVEKARQKVLLAAGDIYRPAAIKQPADSGRESPNRSV